MLKKYLKSILIWRHSKFYSFNSLRYPIFKCKFFHSCFIIKLRWFFFFVIFRMFFFNYCIFVHVLNRNFNISINLRNISSCVSRRYVSWIADVRHLRHRLFLDIARDIHYLNRFTIKCGYYFLLCLSIIVECLRSEFLWHRGLDILFRDLMIRNKFKVRIILQVIWCVTPCMSLRLL